MAHPVKAPSVSHNDLCFIPRTHEVGKKKGLLHIALYLHMYLMAGVLSKYTHYKINENIKPFKASSFNML